VSRRINVGDLSVVVDEAGAGGRPLLLVHGFAGCRDDFAPVVPAVVDAGWHVVSPDSRGHGDSDQPPGEDAYDLAGFADDVLGLADALGWARFTLLGHSLGGMVAQEVVLRAPARVEALVLMATTPAALELDPAEMATAAAIVRAAGLERLIELMNDGDDPVSSPAAERAARQIPGYRERGERNARRCSGAMYARILDHFHLAPDRSPELAVVSCPTLVIVGDEDPLMARGSRRLAEVIPGARLVVVPDAGHNPQFENPGPFLAALLDFLAGVAPPGVSAPSP
jgi:pimeloyl-ACP methyl ester carboxylesterase